MDENDPLLNLHKHALTQEEFDDLDRWQNIEASIGAFLILSLFVLGIVSLITIIVIL